MKLNEKVDGVRASTVLLLVGATVLFIFSSYMWRKFIFMSDRRVVWSAIENALSTDGVQIVVDDSTDQTVQKTTTKLDFSGDIGAETRTEFKNDKVDTLLRTVSTKEQDFVCYERNNNVATPQFKELEGTCVNIATPGQTESKTLADTLMNGSLILAGNMSSADHKKLIKQMKLDKVYTIMGLAKTETVGGRVIRTYKVKINPTAYNISLAAYFTAIGLDQAASQVQPSNTDTLQPIFEIAIDVQSRQATAIGYPEVTSLGGREYSGWGSKYSFDLPTSSISSEELQKKTESIYTPGT